MKFISDDAIDVKLGFFINKLNICNYFIFGLEMVPLRGTSLKEVSEMGFLENPSLLSVTPVDIEIIDNSGQIIHGVFLGFTENYSWVLRVEYFDSTYIDIDINHSVEEGDVLEFNSELARSFPGLVRETL